METIKIYIAGKVSKESYFNTHYWRDAFCEELARKSGYKIINLDPTKYPKGFDENNAKLMFGRDCYMIQQADIVIVNLTDDISVGGSQEMLIAKHYKKPLIGIAPKGGKFNLPRKELMGKVYKNWVHPFVAVICDKVVENLDQTAISLQEFFLKEDLNIKDLSILDNNCEYYKQNFRHLDQQF